jgi:hypothetical protein
VFDIAPHSLAAGELGALARELGNSTGGDDVANPDPFQSVFENAMWHLEQQKKAHDEELLALRQRIDRLEESLEGLSTRFHGVADRLADLEEKSQRRAGPTHCGASTPYETA